MTLPSDHTGPASTPTAGVPPRYPVGPKGNWQSLVGRTITSVVTRERAQTGPRYSVYLIFADGTHFELFTHDGTLCGNSQAYPGNLFDVVTFRDPGDDLRVFA